MRIVIAFDFEEEDVDEVTSIFDYVLEKFSRKTLVQSIYDPKVYKFSDSTLLGDIEENVILGAMIDRMVSITGYTEDIPSSYPNKLSHSLDLTVFAERLGDMIFNNQLGQLGE